MKQNNFYLKVEEELKKKADIVSALKKILNSMENQHTNKVVKKEKITQRIKKTFMRNDIL